MTHNCKGCGEPMENIMHALSRYGHGKICSECGTLEAFYGDFIKEYSNQLDMEYPADHLTR